VLKYFSEVISVESETKTTLRIPNDVKEILKQEAERQHRSLHNLMLAILYDYADSVKKEGAHSQEKP
jgi:predicted HicB family RNase H-like nuclease